MFKVGVFVTLLCLAIFIEEAQSCWWTQGPQPGGKKKRDVEAVEEYQVENVVPMDDYKAQEMEVPAAQANKFRR